MLLLGVVALLAACASGARPKIDQSRVDQLVMRGYLSDTRRAISEIAAEWSVQGETRHVEWTLPDSGSHLPLVIYLPGLGESRAAGQGWRNSWAAAGYAVLSVQLLDEDQQVRPPRADKAEPKDAADAERDPRVLAADRRDALHERARQRYLGSAVRTRLGALAALMQSLRQGIPGEEDILPRLDLSRVALAGFDVGAYTAMLAAGEIPSRDWIPVTLPLPLSAIVAISPFADFSGRGFSERYEPVRLPVLSISGSADLDAAGVVASPFLRRAPYDHLVHGPAYLLWLTGATHAVLAASQHVPGEPGTDSRSDGDEPARMAPPAGAGSGGGSPGSGGRRNGNRRSVTAGGSGLGAPRGAPRDATMSATDQAISETLATGTSVAFLDAYLKQDPLAQQWLGKPATDWIGGLAEWHGHPAPMP